MVFLQRSVRLPDVSRDAIDKPSLKLNFIADLNSIQTQKRIARLNLSNPIDNAFVKCRKPPAAALIETNGVCVVVGGGQIDPLATLPAGVFFGGGQESGTNAVGR
jgi:hypothetical protein